MNDQIDTGCVITGVELCYGCSWRCQEIRERIDWFVTQAVWVVAFGKLVL